MHSSYEDLRATDIWQQNRYTPEYLVDEYGDSVYRFCRSLTYSKEDADDLFQDVFLTVIEQSGKIDSTDNPKGFLFSAAMFMWKSRKRKYARRKRIAPTEAPDDTIAADADVEKDYIAQEEIRAVRELVEALPDKLKIPIILYYTAELSVADIAEALRIPAGTVKSRLFKARKTIEGGLKPDEE